MWLVPVFALMALALAGQIGGPDTGAVAISLEVTVIAAILLRHGVAGARMQPAPAAGSIALLVGLLTLGVATHRADLITAHLTGEPRQDTAAISPGAAVDARGQRLDQRFVDSHSLNGALLQGADLSGLDLSRADLRGADVRGANLRRANLAGVRANGASLRGADLSRTCLDHTDLRGADLTGADATSADTTDTQVDPSTARTAATWPNTPETKSCRP
jgi:uncharacterized protein YjbI with pentapeptide repeats